MEIPLISNRDFIIFGLQPWDIPIGSNCKNIAAEISKHNRVLYVNRPLDRISKFKSRKDIQTKNRLESIKLNKNILVEVSPQLWVLNPPVILESINFLPAGMIYRFFNKLNNRRLSEEISRASYQLKFADPILLVDDDFFNGLYLKEFLRPSLFVYYIRDYLLSQKYFLRHGRAAEPLIIKKADAVAANSKYLASYGAKFNPNSVDVGQGCDVEDFLAKPDHIPDDIQRLKYPVIGYCGSLTSTRLDIELIEFIAVSKPEWNVVLVGPEDENFVKSSLHQLPNVTFTGSKPQEDLPLYIHAFDVCINPQLLNQMTIGNYPRKVDEYLAAGKPVVATNTEAMHMFGSQVFLCAGNEDYLSAIGQALNAGKDDVEIKKRIDMAKSHTWPASVSRIYSLISKTITKNERR